MNREPPRTELHEPQRYMNQTEPNLLIRLNHTNRELTRTEPAESLYQENLLNRTDGKAWTRERKAWTRERTEPRDLLKPHEPSEPPRTEPAEPFNQKEPLEPAEPFFQTKPRTP